ncbi:hypothetical protein BGZ95_002794 [Linnemannia exigua]|uniref:Copper radical oxidase n=1 Tax=Linnemannia exigua TaxID=604196 RepID=A0AAD4H2U1_9FUNG|nr:hypothetical protein BGZ95_002794 [Linnemannia exigua]
MTPFNTHDTQGGDYVPLQSAHSTASRNRRKTLRLQRTRKTRSSQESSVSPTSSHSPTASTHSRSSSSHSHYRDSPVRSPASSSGSPIQRFHSEEAKSPLLTSPGTPTQSSGSLSSYPQLPRYYSLKRCSLIAILTATLIAATFLPHFPSGSDAALNESGGANVLNYAAGMASRTVSAASLGGQWDLIGHSGVSAMHAVLRPFSDSILFLERVQASTFAKIQGTSENGNKGEHFAWSTEFSANDGQWRALNIKSNVFCSAGGYLPDGTVVSVAGGQPSDEVEQGYDGIRLYKPCNGTRCDWKQDFEVHLQEKRWYPTVEALANGDLFILGGSNHAASINNERVNVPNFETFPALPGPKKTIDFPFLVETLPHNLYPIVHLLPDKNLFILANTQAVILSTSTWKIIKRLPDIPGPPRNYPLTGGSVILPLTPENNFEPEILVCGGATDFSTQAKGVASCGRIAPLSKNPTWEMEDMPFGRMMPDMAHLADGSIVIVNGANTGTAGFDRASDPVLHPVQYLPNERKGRRFRVWNPSVIARMYHSVAFMLPDSSLLVAGSNPNGSPIEYGEGDFPTEFRVERFSPPYLFPRRSTEAVAVASAGLEGSNDEITLEGTVVGTAVGDEQDGSVSLVAQGDIVVSPTLIKYGEPFDLSLQWYNHYPEDVRVALVQPGFITHSTHMSQRYVGLEVLKRGEKTVAATGESHKEAGLVRVKAPATNGLAPPGHYMIVVLLDGVPVTEAKWVQLAA